MLEIKNISKAFGANKVLQDLSFTVNPGEIVGFLGPNGAGKTTTMRIIAGYIAADQGSVEVNNFKIEKNPTKAQANIGYLPENNPLYKDMLVSEILSLAAELKNISKSKRKSELDFVIKATGIDAVYYRAFGELSKGFKQRVGLATALLGQPPIIILDEPTEGLDPNQRTEIRNLIKDLAKERTIIMSTHVLQEASAICNRIIIINKGKIVADGSQDQILNQTQQDKVIEAEIEGANIETIFNSVEGLKNKKITQLSNNHSLIEITPDPTTTVQPIISKLAAQNNWIIWKLNEHNNKLEDVFGQLTK